MLKTVKNKKTKEKYVHRLKSCGENKVTHLTETGTRISWMIIRSVETRTLTSNWLERKSCRWTTFIPMVLKTQFHYQLNFIDKIYMSTVQYLNQIIPKNWEEKALNINYSSISLTVNIGSGTIITHYSHHTLSTYFNSSYVRYVYTITTAAFYIQLALSVKQMKWDDEFNFPTRNYYIVHFLVQISNQSKHSFVCCRTCQNEQKRYHPSQTHQKLISSYFCFPYVMKLDNLVIPSSSTSCTSVHFFTYLNND